MLHCTKCSRDLPEKEAFVYKDAKGVQHIICPECFEKAAGIDYKTKDRYFVEMSSKPLPSALATRFSITGVFCTE